MATSTDVPLYTGTISGTSTNTVTIPITDSSYTNLKVVVSTRTTNLPAILLLQMNGDTGTNYSHTAVGTAGSTAGSTRSSSQGAIYLSSYSHQNSTQSTYTFYVMNYSNTNMNKTVLVRGSNSSYGVDIAAGLWRSNSAVTSLTVFLDRAEYWAAGSTFSVYGVGAASPAKATGGAIYSDSNYWYHVFTSTGTFTPSQTLTADILSVAGGGGGWAGAGGAGGHVLTTSQSLVGSTSYTCTVGAGGPKMTTGGQGGNSNVTGGALSLTAAVGGGYGGGGSGMAGGNGGSGGGGGWGFGPGGSGTAGQGYAGGQGTSGGGGSGGGAGGAASNPNGGPGINTYSSSYLTATAIGDKSGTDYYISSGGGWPSSVGGGGYAVAGKPNTGGGGGGDNNGGSGFVIVRYAK